jgi:hypothetical protein
LQTVRAMAAEVGAPFHYQVDKAGNREQGSGNRYR